MQVLFDTLSAMAPLENCPECGSIMSHLNATFLSQNGKTWNVPLRAWLKCDLWLPKGPGTFSVHAT